MNAYKTQGILMPKLRQFINSRYITNNGYTYINRNRRSKTPIRRIKPDRIISTFPIHNGKMKKPFSRAGPCRIGMVQYCQRAKRYEEPITSYPVYPGMEKSPLSSYVANWRWYVQTQRAPERKSINPAIKGVGMDGSLQSKNKSRLEEIQKALQNKPIPNPSNVERGKDVYRE